MRSVASGKELVEHGARVVTPALRDMNPSHPNGYLEPSRGKAFAGPGWWPLSTI